MEDERDWYGERRKPIAKGAIHKGRKQNDPGKNDHSGVKGKHICCSQLPASRHLAHCTKAEIRVPAS
jgi:hypothetical protein